MLRRREGSTAPQHAYLDARRKQRRRNTKRSLIALATFVGVGLLSTTFAAFAAFAQDGYGGITNSRGGYGGAAGYQTTYTR